MQYRVAVALAFGLIAVVALFAMPRGGEGGGERYLDEVFDTLTTTNNVAYGEAIDEFGQPQTLRMNVFAPEGDSETDRPVVIVVHGGGFTDGGRNSPNIVDLAQRLARRGYVVASITYRLREAGFPEEDRPEVIRDAQHDAQAAIRWFRTNAGDYDLDPDKISIAGYSAGAGTSLAAAYNPDDPGDSGNPGVSSHVGAVVDISGGVEPSHMEAGEPPVMVVHGTNDATAPYAYALAIVDRANDVGIDVEFHSLQGKLHNKFETHIDSIAEWAGAFFYTRVVDPGAPIPTATAMPTPTPRPTSTGEPGDANCSGGTDAIDASLILQRSAGLITQLPCTSRADVNHDGTVNALDAALILQYTAGIIDELPA